MTTTAMPKSARSVTRNQVRILRCTAQGLTTDQAAHELKLSESTVRTELSDTQLALGAENRVHAVAIALALGLIDFPVVPHPVVQSG